MSLMKAGTEWIAREVEKLRKKSRKSQNQIKSQNRAMMMTEMSGTRDNGEILSRRRGNEVGKNLPESKRIGGVGLGIVLGDYFLAEYLYIFI